MEERLGGMEGHLTELFDAADAVRTTGEGADDGAYRAAMRGLHKGGELPGIDADALAVLHQAAEGAVRAEGRADRAQAVTTVASACAACHTARGVPAGDMPSDDAVRVGLAALIWQDEATWKRALTLKPSLLDGDDWPARSASVSTALTH